MNNNKSGNFFRDLRKYSTQTTFRLIFGGLILLFIVGIGLIYLIYGSNAAAMGLLCVLAGFIPILLILLFFFIIDKIIKKNRD